MKASYKIQEDTLVYYQGTQPMNEFEHKSSKEGLEDLLFIGRMRAKQAHMIEALSASNADYTSLQQVVMSIQPEGELSAPNAAPAVIALTQVLDGDKQAAADFVSFYMISMMTDNVHAAMGFKTVLAGDGNPSTREVNDHLSENIAYYKKEMTRWVAQVSESPPLVCNIAVDAYIKALGREYGLAEYGIGRDSHHLS